MTVFKPMVVPLAKETGEICTGQVILQPISLKPDWLLEPTLDAHMTLARLMEQLGRNDEAIRHVRRSAELAR